MSRVPGRERAILFAEVPGFYAAVERATDITLRSTPILVGGHPDKRGTVQSASPEALAAGVAPGMSMREALSLCPTARRLPSDLRRYREVSGALCVCLRRRSGEVEPAGLGAAYLEAYSLGPAPEQLAEQLARAVESELELPLRVGIAPVKFLARLLAQELPAGGVRRVAGSCVQAYLEELPLARLPRVGPRTLAKLESLGARTAGELTRIDRRRLEEALGNHGLEILELARGRDRTRVRVARHPASIGREARLDDVSEGRIPAELAARIHALAHKLEIELQRQGLCARRVALRLRRAERAEITRSITLGAPVESAARIEEVASDLIERIGDPATCGVRRVALRVAGLTALGEEPSQPELFSSRVTSD